jgi:hypothetical protein
VQQHSRVAKLEEANTALRAELAATHTKVAEVEHCERALASDYGSLRNDFNDLQSAHTAIVKEKADLKKMKRDKVRRFATCCAKNWPGFAMIWRSRLLCLGGNAWTFSLLIPLSPACWSDFVRRFKRCLPPLLNVTRISLVSLLLVFVRCS